MPRLGVQTSHVTDGETEVWGEAQASQGLCSLSQCPPCTNISTCSPLSPGVQLSPVVFLEGGHQAAIATHLLSPFICPSGPPPPISKPLFGCPAQSTSTHCSGFIFPHQRMFCTLSLNLCKSCSLFFYQWQTPTHASRPSINAPPLFGGSPP